ncbi:FRG1-like family-domain-containing protein [Peziza echinospora]|nr:FRG1-like family-domain-containing protein [Peziza echinospora]
MVKALTFKGDKKTKKRKRTKEDVSEEAEGGGGEGSSSTAIATTTTTTATTGHGTDEPEGWVTMEAQEELVGPIMLTFAATKPICLACDATGKVFASILETIEGENLHTAEPLEVKQVWVVTKIHGSDSYSFKSHHGKYLSCDKFGILTATREAISHEEGFIPVKTEVGGWAFQTAREKYIGVEDPKSGGTIEIRGDAEEIGFCQTWTVRGQAKYKKKTKKEENRIRDKITRKELEAQAGVKLDDEQVKKLKKARREGGFHEALLDIRVKHGKHDKYAY